MTRIVLTFVVSLFIGAVIYWFSHNSLAAWLAGGFALLAGMFDFLKKIIEPFKLSAETRKLHYEAEEKKRNVEDRDRQIVAPSSEEIRRYGTPYRLVERDILAAYQKERQPLPNKEFIVDDSELR